MQNHRMDRTKNQTGRRNLTAQRRGEKTRLYESLWKQPSTRKELEPSAVNGGHGEPLQTSRLELGDTTIWVVKAGGIKARVSKQEKRHISARIIKSAGKKP